MLKEILCLSDLGFILILTLVLIFLLILILDPREEKRCQKKSGKCCLWCLSDLCWILQIAQQADSPGSAGCENLRKNLTQNIGTQKRKIATCPTILRPNSLPQKRILQPKNLPQNIEIED